MSKPIEDFGEALKRARLNQTPPATQFWIVTKAKDLGCKLGESAVINIETGKTKRPRMSTINILARIFPQLREYL